MIEGHDFVDAYFINNERTVVEALWYSPTDDVYRTHMVVAEEGEADWNKLLETVNIDDLHERTYKRIKEQDAIFKETLIDIAKNDDNSWVAYKDDLNKDALKAFIDVVFKENPNEEDENSKEKLFLYKLELGSSIHDIHIHVFHKSSYEGIWQFWRCESTNIDDWDKMFDYDPYFNRVPPGFENK